MATTTALEAQTSFQRDALRANTATPPERPSVPAPQRLSVPAPIHYGKWLALGGATALGFVAAGRHHDANAAYTTLQSRCDADPTGCQLVGGKYVDPVNEGLYQDTRRLDHQAARFLIGAETLFAGAAVGFIWELMHHQDEPRNIPFEPRVESDAQATRIGLSIPFRASPPRPAP